MNFLKSPCVCSQAHALGEAAAERAANTVERRSRGPGGGALLSCCSGSFPGLRERAGPQRWRASCIFTTCWDDSDVHQSASTPIIPCCLSAKSSLGVYVVSVFVTKRNRFVCFENSSVSLKRYPEVQISCTRKLQGGEARPPLWPCPEGSLTQAGLAVYTGKGMSCNEKRLQGPGERSPHGPAAQWIPAHPSPAAGLLFFLKTKTNYGQTFICDCFVKWSNPLMVFNLPVFEQIINVVAIKTKEVNQIQLAGNETEPSNNYNELCTGDPATACCQQRPSLKIQFGSCSTSSPTYTHCKSNNLLTCNHPSGSQMFHSLFLPNSKTRAQWFRIPLNRAVWNTMLSSRKKFKALFEETTPWKLFHFLISLVPHGILKVPFHPLLAFDTSKGENREGDRGQLGFTERDTAL